jgi:hypothetical protein
VAAAAAAAAAVAGGGAAAAGRQEQEVCHKGSSSSSSSVSKQQAASTIKQQESANTGSSKQQQPKRERAAMRGRCAGLRHNEPKILIKKTCVFGSFIFRARNVGPLVSEREPHSRSDFSRAHVKSMRKDMDYKPYQVPQKKIYKLK